MKPNMILTCLAHKVNLNRFVPKFERFIWFYLFLFIYLRPVNTFEDNTYIPATTEAPRISAVVQKRADLPCPSRPRSAHDRPILVLWYRESINKPVYSYDARVGNFSSGERWSNKSLFGERAYFVPLIKPPALILEPVMPQDEGLYTCRLDYMDSPTTSTSTYLKVIVFPTPPEILWNGHHIFGPVGPIREDSVHKFTCITQGGRPLPTLVWWKEGHRAMNQKQEEGRDREMKSVLTLEASREVNMMSFSCHAQIREGSVPIAQPLIASMRLNITLPPLGIVIQGGEHSVAVDTTLTLVCLSWGSHPPAEITWWKSGKKLKSFSYSIKDGGNLTASEIKVVVDTLDNGVTFTCRSSNVLLADHPLIAGRRLNVTYKPLVELRVKVSTSFISASSLVSSKLKSVTVKPGSAIQLECSSDANPMPHYIEWHHNGVIIDAGKDSWSLFVDRATKEKSGFYSCAATNQAGRGVSAAYDIIVEHSPECSVGWQKRTQGTEIGRTVTVLCRVEALPFQDLSFSWFKLGDHNIEDKFDPNQVQTDGTTSRLTLTPNALSDFGTLLCRATNSVGTQEVPCKVNLVPASPPDPPFNCSSDSGGGAGTLSVACLEGFDGGFPQKFNLVAVQNGKVKANITRDFPEWSIENLEYGKGVTLRIYAHNARGRSESLRIEVFIAMPQIMSDEDVNSRNVETKSFSQRATLPLMGILVGTGGVLVIVSIVILFIFCSSRNRLLPWPPKSSRSTSTEVEASPAEEGAPSPTFELIRGAEGETCGNKTRLISDPDVVTCIPYASRTPSYKGLDVLPSGNTMHQPLIDPSNRNPDLNIASCSSFSRDSLGNIFAHDCEDFETEVLKCMPYNASLAGNISEQECTIENHILDKEFNALKGAIPKHIQRDGEQSGTSCSAPIISNEIVEQDCVTEQKSQMLVPILSEPNFPIYNRSFPCSYNSEVMCNQCCHQNKSTQGQLPCLANNHSTSSLTYSNACCVDHYGPYYVYKHVKCYPHKNYEDYNELRIMTDPPQVNPYCSYSPANASGNDTHGQVFNGINNEVPKSHSDQLLDSVYEESKQLQPSLLKMQDTEGNLAKNKHWSNSCGDFSCVGRNKNGSMNRKIHIKKRSSIAMDNPNSTYKKFDGVCPYEIPLNVINSKDNLLKKQKISPHAKSDCLPRTKPPGNICVTSSETAGNLKPSKTKSERQVSPISNLHQSNINKSHSTPLKNFGDKRTTNKVKSGSVPTKSLIHLKDIGNSKLYKKRELQRLHNLKRLKATEHNEASKSSKPDNKKMLDGTEESDSPENEISSKLLLKPISTSRNDSNTEPQALLSGRMETKPDSPTTTENISNKTDTECRRPSKSHKGVTLAVSELKLKTELKSLPKTDNEQQLLPLKSILRKNSKQ